MVNNQCGYLSPVGSRKEVCWAHNCSLYSLYINYLPDNIDSSVYMYTDHTKLYREIREPRDHEILQEDLNKLSVWSDLWLLKFHPENVFL